MDNGYWGYRYAIVINGKRKEGKKLKNELENPFKTARQAALAREIAIEQEKTKTLFPPQKKRVRKTVAEIYQVIKIKRQQEKDKKELALQRQQNQTFIQDLNGELMNC